MLASAIACHAFFLKANCVRPDWQARQVVLTAHVGGGISFQPGTQAQDRNFGSGKNSTSRIGDGAENSAELSLRPGWC